MTEGKDATELQQELDRLNEQKERAFTRKQELGSKIQEKIHQISEYRQQRNNLTKQVRELKKERDALNAQITAKISEIKDEMPKRKRPLPKDEKGRPLSPRRLQGQIQQLEEKLETVPMNFDAEQKLTKKIKDIKKQLGEAEGSLGLSGELAGKSREIDELKEEANALHAKVTDLAKESQQYHEKMLALSTEIDELKGLEDEAYQEFVKCKQAYLEKAGDVKEVRQEAHKERSAKRARHRAEQQKKEEEDKKTLQERAKEAQEKIVKGKKLTTEDLLALQGVKD